MDRRQVLRHGIALGGAAVGGTLLAPGPSEAAAAPMFYRGTVSGTGFTGWTFFLVVTGAKARGSAFDPATITRPGGNGTGMGVNLVGSVRRGALNLLGYALDDYGMANPVANLTGQITGDDLAGTLAMGMNNGVVAANRPALRKAREFRGHLGRRETIFDVFDVNGNLTQPLSGKVNITAAGTITVTNIKALVPQVVVRRGLKAKFYYFVTTDNHVYVVADQFNRTATGITMAGGGSGPQPPIVPEHCPGAGETDTEDFDGGASYGCGLICEALLCLFCSC